MSGIVRKHPFVTVVLIALALGASIFFWYVGRNVRADTPGPAVLRLETVTVYAPGGAGSGVYVDGQVDGSLSGMSVSARSVTRDNLLNGGTPSWQPLSYYAGLSGQPGDFYGYIQAGYGDLIEVRAENDENIWQGIPADVQQVGYVPAGTDDVPPDFDTDYVSELYSFGTTFTVTFDAYPGIYDPSYPLTVTLYEADDPSNSSTITIQDINDYPRSVSISIASGQLARVFGTDGYGNARMLVYDTGQLYSSEQSGAFAAEASLAGAERTGNQAVGGEGVQLHNGGFVHSEHLFSVGGRVLTFPVGLHYRSNSGHDGRLGRRWDSILGSAIVVAGNDVTWRPGNGREEPFTYQFDPTGFWWNSPVGLFVRLTIPEGGGGLFTFTTSGGTEYHYKNNHLSEIRDPNGNSVLFQRDWQGRLFAIVDDLGRRYQLSYYDHDRLAEVIDPTGRRVVLLGYDGIGQLKSIGDAAGYERTFDYTGGVFPQRLTKLYDRNGRLALENVYNFSGDRVLTQKIPLGNSQIDPGAPQFGEHTFDYAQMASGSVSVTDSLATVTTYGFDADNSFLLESVTTAKNQALRDAVSATDFPGHEYVWTGAVDEVIQKTEYDLLNYLPKQTWIESKTGPGDPIKETPFTWRFYESGTQTDPSIDPRRFGNLRLLRRDELYGDDNRIGDAIRESWTYTADNRVEKHWGRRAWIGVAVEAEDPANWDSWESTYLDNAFKTTYGYDAAGNLQTITRPDVSVPIPQPVSERTGIVESFTYNAHGQITTATDAEGGVTNYQYYGPGLFEGLLEKQWVELTSGSPNVVDTFEYDVLGRAVARIDGLGRRWETDYDDLDRVVAERTPSHSSLGVLETLSFYDGEQLREVWRTNKASDGMTPAGEPGYVKTVYYYDPDSGALTQETRDVWSSADPNAPVTASTFYFHDGLLRTVHTEAHIDNDPGGLPIYRTRDTLLDSLGRSVRTISYLSPVDEQPADYSNDALTDTYYDGSGSVTQSVDPVGLATTYVYDTYGRPTETATPDGIVEVTEYNDDATVSQPSVIRSSHTGNPSDPFSKSETFADELDRGYLERAYVVIPDPPQEGEPPPPDPVWHDTTTHFDRVGRSIRRFDGSQTELTNPHWAWEYDQQGRVHTAWEPAWDPEPERRTRQLSFFDAAGNLERVEVREWNEREELSKESITTYTYDELGMQASVDADGVVTSFFYDSQGRLEREFLPLGAQRKKLYDLAGNLFYEAEKIGDNGTTVTWQETQYAHDLSGRTKSRSVLTGGAWQTTLYGRDELQVTEGVREWVTHPHTGEITQILYDVAGRRTELIDPRSSRKIFQYDPVTGALATILITTASTTFRGTSQIDYFYDVGGACGCSGRKPTRIVSYDVDPDSDLDGNPDEAFTTTVERTYDAAGRVTTETVTVERYKNGVAEDPYGSTVRHEYDDDGNAETVYFEEAPSGRVLATHYTRRELDASGRLRAVRTNWPDPDPTAEPVLLASYDYEGSKIVLRHYTAEQTHGQAGGVVENRSTFHRGNWEGNTWTWESSPPAAGVTWVAGYDDLDRITTKGIYGGAVSGGVYEFQYDLRGLLTRTDYPVEIFDDLTKNPPSFKYMRDFSTTDYGWDTSGAPTTQEQCFEGENKQPPPTNCLDDGYTFTLDESGTVTDTIGKRVLGYYDEDLEDMAEYVEEVARGTDANGNMTSIDLNLVTLDNPDDNCGEPAEDACCALDPEDRPPCCANQAKTASYSWEFNHDADDRLTFARKLVQEFDCQGTPTRLYVLDYRFVYDGEGRRVLTITDQPTEEKEQNAILTSLGYDPMSAPVSFGAPDFVGGEGMDSIFLNVHDRHGNVLQREDHLWGGTYDTTYFHGADSMPILGDFVKTRNDSVKSYFFLTDQMGNTEAVMTCTDGSLDDQTATAHCGNVNVLPSILATELVANVYQNSYGQGEEGLRLVDRRNWSPMVIAYDGSVYDTETKGGGVFIAQEERLKKCCCVKDMKISVTPLKPGERLKNPVTKRREKYVGDYFEVKVEMEWVDRRRRAQTEGKKMDPKKGEDFCVLEWWEWGNLIPPHFKKDAKGVVGDGKKPGEWSDSYQILSTSKTFVKWNERNRGAEEATIRDNPGLPEDKDPLTHRVLFIGPKVFSAPDCPCENKTEKRAWLQELERKGRPLKNWRHPAMKEFPDANFPAKIKTRHMGEKKSHDVRNPEKWDREE